MDKVQNKICKMCNEEKNLDQFTKGEVSCKDCRSIIYTKHYNKMTKIKQDRQSNIKKLQ